LAHAENSPGYAYDTGKGITQDLSEASKWYSLAIEQNERNAKAMEKLLPRPTPKQVAEGKTVFSGPAPN
jgi:TPR repeat protein